MSLDASIGVRLGAFELDVEVTCRAGRGAGGSRPERVGQVDVAARSRRTHRDRPRPHRHRWHRPRRSRHRHVRPSRTTTDRRRVPGPSPLCAHERARERRLRPTGSRCRQSRGSSTRRSGWLDRVGLADVAGHATPATLGWPGATSRTRTSPGDRSGDAAARRATRGARRGHAPGRATQSAPTPRNVRRCEAARHPRSRSTPTHWRTASPSSNTAASPRPARSPKSPRTRGRVTSPSWSAPISCAES